MTEPAPVPKNEKPKVAFYWCASCGGCEETVLDLDERVLDVVAAVDIVFWPVALDFKRRDVEAMPDGSIAAAFINGAIRNSEQEEMAHLLRRKSQTVIAFGVLMHLMVPSVLCVFFTLRRAVRARCRRLTHRRLDVKTGLCSARPGRIVSLV